MPDFGESRAERTALARHSDVWVNQGSERERADDLLNRGNAENADGPEPAEAGTPYPRALKDWAIFGRPSAGTVVMLNRGIRGIRGRAGLAWSGGNGDLFVISIWFFVFKFVSSLCNSVTNPVTVVTGAKKSEKKCS